jgi:hypothetical protein
VTRRSTVSKPAKTQHQKPTRPKRSSAAVAARHGRPSVADLQEKLDARARQLKEAMERENATVEVLRVISTSQSLQPVLDTVVTNAARLCEAPNATIYLRDGDILITSAHVGPLGGTPSRWPEAAEP